MYIDPNTIIRFLKNVPLDETYEHTIYFSNATNQQNYFTSKTKFIVDRSTYQRVNKGSLKIGHPADNVYDCNYIMFQNRGFSNKWFYAFITAVEYVNNETCQVNFVLDDMQTWMFDYELEQCFVEREHTATDVIGEHTVPEGLELGGYITTNEIALSGGDYSITILATEPIPDTDVTPTPTAMNEPQIVDGYPLPLYYKHIPYPSMHSVLDSDLIATIKAYSRGGKSNALVAIFTHPKHTTGASSLASRTLPISVKNNKLYCYPYCALSVLCGATSMELKYELFSGNPTAKLYTCVVSPSASITVVPQNYEGMSEDFSRAISLKGFPPLPWINNYYQNWYAQNCGSIHTGFLQGASNMLMGGITLSDGLIKAIMSQGASGTGTATSGATQINNSLISAVGNAAEIYKHSVMPDTMGGTIDSVDNLFSVGQLRVRSYCRTIRPEYIRIIDDFFTKFGYKVNRNKIPNTHSRPHWNYVKTVSCTIKGSVPADSMKHICQIYDNGITFWKNGNEIGNYSLDNRP